MKDGEPALPVKSAFSLILPLHKESEELRPPGIVNLPILADVAAKDALHAFFLHFNHSQYTSFPHLQASVSHWQERRTWSECNKKPRVAGLRACLFPYGRGRWR